MDDSGAGGDGVEILEGFGAPLKELESLEISFEFDSFVFRGGVVLFVDVGLDGVVDDEVDGDLGVDFWRVSAEGSHGVSHDSEVDDAGNSGEILEDNSGGFEGDFDVFAGVFLPG